MDIEKISNLIKDIRKKNNLSQQKFAEKYGVSFQAVSKWERGLNLPDIVILKKICDDFNIDMNTFFKKEKKKKNGLIFIIPIVILILITIIVFLVLNNKNDSSFEFKTLTSTCENFTLYGSIAYNNSKTSIHISNVTYCGGDDTTEYNAITCTLYESVNKTKTEISKYDYSEGPITLEEFLKGLTFNVDHYDKTCKIYKENSLFLEIEAQNKDGALTSYRVPLNLDDNC